MKRLTRLNKGDTRRIEKALTSMHKALDELGNVLGPRLALEESVSTEQTSDTQIICVFTDILSVFRTMLMMLDYTKNFSSLAGLLLDTPTTLKSPNRVVFVPKYPDSAKIDWDKARGILTMQEYTILEYRLGAKEEPRTLEVVSQDFQITRERVRQIQMTAVRKLETAGLLIK